MDLGRAVGSSLDNAFIRGDYGRLGTGVDWGSWRKAIGLWILYIHLKPNTAGAATCVTSTFHSMACRTSDADLMNHLALFH